MSKQRRSFSPEFKRGAASLVLDQSYNHGDASRSVGLAESVLRRWALTPRGSVQRVLQDSPHALRSGCSAPGGTG